MDDIIEEEETNEENLSKYMKYSKFILTIYYKSFFWIGYMIISIVISVQPFNLLNFIQLILLFSILMTHLLKMRKHPASADARMYFLWNAFIVSKAIITGIKYFYNFTK